MTRRLHTMGSLGLATFAVIGAAMLSSCTSHVAPSTYTATATIYGFVRDANDRPLAGVSVGAEVRTADCNVRQSGPDSFVRPVTDNAGRYSLLLQIPVATTHCVRLVTTRINGSDSLSVVLPAVTFRFSNTDSVRADLRLQ